jgi:CRISPR system Cascade subunit CasA
MNLLQEPWIPVQRDNASRQITFKELLCRDEPWQVSLSRDDLEMACLQLLIALTQALFTPRDRDEWLMRHDAPMSEGKYDAQGERYSNWFDLDHPTQPFMQTRGVRAKEVTPIQKLFVGLPEGNNHAFFHRVSEIETVCSSCAAIALFNQACATPSFGGGFKASLRGMAPITTVVYAGDLRQLIWRNVLHGDLLNIAMPGWAEHHNDDKPVWARPINANQHAAAIGLKRGLFWQPARLELIVSGGQGHCDCCGLEFAKGYTGLKKEKFTFTVEGHWPHPLSPRQWATKKGELQVSVPSFSTTAPAWTQLTQFVLEKNEAKEGHSSAPVVTQYRQVCDLLGEGQLFLLVGGYRNKRAAILERRHELFNLAVGWAEHAEDVSEIVDLGLRVKDALRGSLYSFGRSTGIRTQEQGEAQYYRQSEPTIHRQLRDMDFREFKRARHGLAQDLSALALEIFEQQTAPYRHRPEIYRVIALARSGLRAKLNMLAKGDHQDAA